MKTTFKYLAIALIAIIGLSFAACGDGGEEGNGGNNGSLGATLTISNAQVYTIDYENLETEIAYIPFGGTVTGLNYVYVPDPTGEDGEIKPLNEVFNGANAVTLVNGKLSISLGTPKASAMISFEYVKTLNPTLAISNSAANYYGFAGITDEDDNKSIITNGEVLYMYADRNVSVRGTVVEDDEYDGGAATVVYAMDLKTGWNTVILTETKVNGQTVGSTIKTGKPAGNEKWIYLGFDY
jgi:hypothetical protein